VALIRVQQPYLDPDLPGGPTANTAAAAAAAVSGCFLQGHAAALIRVQQPYLDPDLPGGLQRFPSADTAAAAAAAAAASGMPVSRRAMLLH
jgi:cobalamin biosynthesis protein CbiD